MSHLAFDFRRCSNPDCGLRYPRLSGAHADSTCPRCGSPTLATYAGVIPPENLGGTPPPRLPCGAMLENIRSAWNVGAMFRTADGVGMAALHLCGITPTPEHPQVAKTALGAERVVAWDYHPDAVTRAEQLRAIGWRLWALEVGPGALPLDSLAERVRGAPLALVVGNEVTGVDPDLQACCEYTVSLPMRGVKRSFNAAVAFGMAAYWLSSQLQD